MAYNSLPPDGVISWKKLHCLKYHNYFLIPQAATNWYKYVWCKNCQNEKHWEALGFASAFRFANALHNIWLQRMSIKLTHICKSVLANSKTTPWYSPRRLVSILLRGVYIIFQTINTLHTPGGLSSVVTKTYYQKHKQTTVYLCPGKGKATLEIDIQIRKGTLCF